MTIALSYYAEEQRSEILRNIAINLSFDDALRWNEKIHNLLMLLAEQPELGHPVRSEIFLTRPLLTERLREIFCGPYRIIYELVDDMCRILSMTHSRQMVSGENLVWDK